MVVIVKNAFILVVIGEKNALDLWSLERILHKFVVMGKSALSVSIYWEECFLVSVELEVAYCLRHSLFWFKKQ